MAIDGYRVGKETLDERLADRQPGERVTLTLFRRDELREVDMTLGQRPYTQVEITPGPTPHWSSARCTRRGWARRGRWNT